MNLAFIVNNLGNSEQNYTLLRLISKINEQSNKVVPSIYFQNVYPSISDVNCLSMNISGLSNFKGQTVSFDLESAQIVSTTNMNTVNWLYLWDLPWTSSVVHYPICIELINKFKLVARSESHKKSIENFTGRSDIYLAKDMDELYTCLT
jgi:hypothetical protein